jgi:hypothetical protein
MPRIPSLQDVAALDRDAWEDVCAALVALLFGAHRVEDRRGRGNGLDAWRRRHDGAYGWQFRRLDDRFGSVQAGKVRDNITNAIAWSISELGVPLRRFTLVLNIDPEPGHGKDDWRSWPLGRAPNWELRLHGVASRGFGHIF